jgi:hypothetical protein
VGEAVAVSTVGEAIPVPLDFGPQPMIIVIAAMSEATDLRFTLDHPSGTKETRRNVARLRFEIVRAMLLD